MERKAIYFWIVLLVKGLLLTTFSSGFKEELFLPFIEVWLESGGNPWDIVLSRGLDLEFPYHPLMLYVFSLVYWPVSALGLEGHFYLANVAFKLPLLLADLAIFRFLLRLFPGKYYEVLLYYFCSPILLYATYMHSQLDLVPTALVVASAYYLIRYKVLRAGLFLGLGAATKLHVVAVYPMMVGFLLKYIRNRRLLLAFAGVPLLVYGVFVLPFVGSKGFLSLVIHNPKQSLIFDSTFPIGNLSIFLPIFALMVIYGRFFSYTKINIDLFFVYIGILFSIFVFFVAPSPGWYLWFLPFLSYYYVKYSKEYPMTPVLYGVMNIAYLVYFVIFHETNVANLIFLNRALSFEVPGPVLRNLSFTILEVSLAATIYVFYRYGVRSNSIYKDGGSTLVGIGGDSGSGKSTLLKDIGKILGRGPVHLTRSVLVLEGDGDHRWERGAVQWQELTHLDPKANYLHRQFDHVLALKKGRAVYRSDYDHDTGKFTQPQKVKPAEFILFSGLHPFYLSKMRRLIDFKIFLDVDETLRQHWKLQRDTKLRGYSRDRVLRQLESRAEDSQKFIRPQRDFADMVVSYFPGVRIEPGCSAADPRIGLRVVLDASIMIEDFCLELMDRGVAVEWDYSRDLATQFLLFPETMPEIDHSAVVRKLVDNPDELLQTSPCWEKGLRGMLQLTVLYVLSQKLKAAEYDQTL